MATPKKSLGRGLGNLIAGGTKPPTRMPGKPVPALPAKKELESPEKAAPLPYQEIPVAKVGPARWQPRREFSSEAIQELAESIRSEGLLQPIVVRVGGDGFELIAGERRWRAFQFLKLKTIPARIVTASDASTAVMTLIENLQRESLNPVEEALGFASLMRDFNLTQESVAERVGKPRATIANSVRLLSLGREIQGYLGKGLLSAGHAKVLLGLEGEADQLLVARRIIEQGASVRETEAWVKKLKAGKPAAGGQNLISNDTQRAAKITAEIHDIEKRLTSRLNTKVQLKHGARQGRIVIEYYGNDDLNRILQKLGAER
mgnify:CR=1 FL=1